MILEKAEQDLIRMALEEDLGTGDVTAAYFVAAEACSAARVVAREPLMVAGTGVVEAVFRAVDESIEVEVTAVDGTAVGDGDVVMEVRGPTRGLLSAERTALNFLQRLSGVATLTRQFVDAVAGTGVGILDTRKTTPGWRVLEKRAVLAGGGVNHRMGLYDQVMVKDNHLLVEGRAGELQDAIERLKGAHPEMKVELEADTLGQVEAFLALRGVDMILLDNMTPEELREAVALSRGRVTLEASGGVALGTVAEIAETGVDFISVGALTHSARAVDLALDFVRENGE